MKIQMVDLGSQYAKIKNEILLGWENTIANTAFINSGEVQSLRQELSNYLNVKHTIACANGTDALTCALMALELMPGDEIITTSFTFVATAESIAFLGLVPIFVDIDPNTFNIDANLIEASITPKTKCIMPVHLYGQSADMDTIMEIANKHNLYVIEDNAQAIGCKHTGKNGTTSTGAIGHIGTTSFYPSKNLGAFGDAGAIFTNDDVLNERLEQIVNHGQSKKYISERVGVNSRLDALQAVVLRAKLKRLDQYNGARNFAADFYDKAFKDVDGINTPYRATYSTHVFHQYTLRLEHADRATVAQKLKEIGIPSMVYYPKPLHLHKPYITENMRELPHTMAVAQKVISLPMHSELTKEQLEYITTHFIKVVKES